jgi:hypothetical protein
MATHPLAVSSTLERLSCRLVLIHSKISLLPTEKAGFIIPMADMLVAAARKLNVQVLSPLPSPASKQLAARQGTARQGRTGARRDAIRVR